MYTEVRFKCASTVMALTRDPRRKTSSLVIPLSNQSQSSTEPNFGRRLEKNRTTAPEAYNHFRVTVITIFGSHATLLTQRLLILRPFELS